MVNRKGIFCNYLFGVDSSGRRTIVIDIHLPCHKMDFHFHVNKNL